MLSLLYKGINDDFVQRYINNIAVSHSHWLENYFPQQKQKCLVDIFQYIDNKYEEDIGNTVFNTTDKRNLKKEAKRILEEVSKSIGFDTGFHEESMMIEVAEDNLCCYCPFHPAVLDRNYNEVPADCRFDLGPTCGEKAMLSRKGLLNHLVEEAYSKSKRFDHVVVLFYLKMFVDDVYKEYINERIYHYSSKTDKTSNDEVNKYSSSIEIQGNILSVTETNVSLVMKTPYANSSSSGDKSSNSTSSIYFKKTFIEVYIDRSKLCNDHKKLENAMNNLWNLKEKYPDIYSSLQKKLDKKIRSLLPSLPLMCQEYFECNQKDSDISNVQYFLGNFSKNKVWNIGILMPLLYPKNVTITSSNEERASFLKINDVSICPCSFILTKWHKKFVFKNFGKSHGRSFPCTTKLLSTTSLVAHVTMLKDKDIYHRIVYEILNQSIYGII